MEATSSGENTQECCLGGPTVPGLIIAVIVSAVGYLVSVTIAKAMALSSQCDRLSFICKS